MVKQKKNSLLKIYLNALPVGTLESLSHQSLKFTYDLKWLERTNPFSISRSLPLREESYEGAPVFAYFDNLLPDSVSIRQRVAARMQAASDQVFDLLSVIGRDCVGALQFIKDTGESPQLVAANGTRLTDQEVAEKLRNLASTPLASSTEEDFRLSIAGAQEKTAFLNLKGKWHLPKGATPTTHIFKPQIGDLRPSLSFADSVENEWLCAQIIREFGLPMAECEMAQFEDIKVLIVKRFDRQWHEDRLIRIPQEDMCQALSKPNFQKYQADGGPKIVDIMQLLNESNSPDEDKYTFMKSQVLFHLLGATDGHAKNYSVHWGPAGFQMTPLYDVLSAQTLVGRGPFQEEKMKLSMSVGENKKYKIREIYRRHFHQTAKECRFDVKVMDQIIDETLDGLPGVIDRVQAGLKKNFPMQIADMIFDGMMRRRQQFARV